MRYAVVVIAAALGLAACSSSSDTGAGTGTTSGSTGLTTAGSGGNGGTTGLTTGGSTSATTTTSSTGNTTSTTGTSNGGTTSTNGFATLSGPYGFNPASVFFEYNRFRDGGIDKHEAFVIMSEQHLDCRDLYADAGTHITQSIAEAVVSFPEDGGTFVHSGTYAITASSIFGQPSPNGSGAVLEFTPLPDGGLTFDQLLLSTSGSVTLSSFSDTRASGSFDSQLVFADGGNAGSLSGSFDAPACY